MTGELERLRRRAENLARLNEAISIIGQDMRLGTVLTQVVHQAMLITGGEACTLWLADEHQYLSPVVSTGGADRSTLVGLKLRPGEGVAGRVYETGQPMIIADVYNHPRWAQRFDQSTGFQTKSILCTPLSARGRRLGSLQVINKVSGGLFHDDDLYLLNALATQSSLVIDSSLMLQQANSLVNGFIENFVTAVDAKDPMRRNHSVKVAEVCLQIGKAMEMTPEELEKLRRAALLHNIGHIFVPDALLKKQTTQGLAPEEQALVKAHTGLGAELLSKVKPATILAEAVQAARQHHERVDGQGYPDGLNGLEISLVARIIAVANLYLDLRLGRPSRAAMSHEQAVAAVSLRAGTEVDADIAIVLAGLPDTVNLTAR